MKAKDLGNEIGLGFRNTRLIEVFGFQFYIYVDTSNHDQTSAKRVYVNIAEKDSAFENTIDFSKQFKDTENAVLHIEKELMKLATVIFSHNKGKRKRNVKRDNLKHKLFNVCLNIDSVGDDDIVALDWEIQDAGMTVWRDKDKPDDKGFNTSDGRFPILVFDNPEWCLATRSDKEEVDIEKFFNLLADYKENK